MGQKSLTLRGFWTLGMRVTRVLFYGDKSVPLLRLTSAALVMSSPTIGHIFWKNNAVKPSGLGALDGCISNKAFRISIAVKGAQRWEIMLLETTCLMKKIVSIELFDEYDELKRDEKYSTIISDITTSSVYQSSCALTRPVIVFHLFLSKACARKNFEFLSPEASQFTRDLCFQ